MRDVVTALRAGNVDAADAACDKISATCCSDSADLHTSLAALTSNSCSAAADATFADLGW